MCTVTFIPSGDKIYFTSNRDEKHGRSAALMPEAYAFPSGKILFPKDGDAGGTWIAVHENGNALVFLNGGLIRHTPEPPYRKSRGLILLDLIEGSTSYNSFLAINLNGIEPFTAVVWDDGHLFECRWDGKRKYTRQMDGKVPHIWSSVTLYETEVIRKRSQWFDRWLQKNQQPSQQDILDFHRFTGDGDQNNDLLMNRDGQVFTVSVTSMAITDFSVSMRYLDVKNNSEHVQEMTFEKSMAGR
jgi:Transport and Golgi organisation 2